MSGILDLFRNIETKDTKTKQAIEDQTGGSTNKAKPKKVSSGSNSAGKAINKQRKLDKNKLNSMSIEELEALRTRLQAKKQ